VSDQQEEEILRRMAREKAEIERQTDALVLQTITALVTASEELRSKLGRDVEAILDGYRRSKRQLENEISLTTAERLRSRREAEQERAAIVADAKEQAREIVEAAEHEREALLGEVRAMEQRLRGLEGQIRSVFGRGEPDADAEPDAEGAAAPSVMSNPGGLAGGAEEQPATPPAPSVSTAAHDSGPDLSGSEPRAGEEAEHAAQVDVAPTFPGPPVHAVALTARDNGISAEAPAAPARPAIVPTLSPAPRPVAPLTPSNPVPVSQPSARPAPAPARAHQPRPAPAHRRPVELVFEGVPGYQQASALEQAVNDLLPNEEIDILQFERGQLVLGLQATDLGRLANQLVAGYPASLELDAVAGDRVRFRCV
jgi:hypothetical protein